jgi:type IV pilus assembly protein PilO
MFRERKQIMIFIVAAVSIASIVLFSFLPLRKEMKALKRDKMLQQSITSGASYQRQQLLQLKQRLLELQKTVENYDSRIPAQRDLGEFLQSIADLMSQQSLSHQLVEHGTEVKVGDLNCIPVSIRCKGSLKQLFEFYRQLRKIDRLVRLSQVELVNDADFRGQVSMQTKAIIYYHSSEQM